MIIDGYTPPDPKIANEQGVDFIYPTAFGEVHIRAKYFNVRSNPQLAVATKRHSDWLARRGDVSTGIDHEAERRGLGILYDYVVIDWSTTITSQGKKIEPNRENFIQLMSSDVCQRPLENFIEDTKDPVNFRPVTEEEDAKNSEASSDGKSSGQDAVKNSSGT